MKQFSIHFLTFLSCSAVFTQRLCANDARTWAHEVATRCSLNEQTMIKAWLDAAIGRSQATLDAQQSYMHLLELVWSQWENVLWTRRNPARELPHKQCSDSLERFARFSAQVAAYHDAGRTYVQLSDQVAAHKHKGESLTMVDLVDRARSGGLQAVWEGLCREYTTIDQVYDRARTAMARASDQLCRHDRLRVGYRWWQSLVSWVPRWIRTVFARFDDGYSAASADCFGALMVSQQASIVLWETVERARLEWLRACRDALKNQA